MTKAERIFKETSWQCLKDIKKGGSHEVGFANVCAKDEKDSVISTRTLNDLDKIYFKKAKDLLMDYKLGVIDKEEAMQEANVLRKVRLTIDNARNRLNEWKEILK